MRTGKESGDVSALQTEVNAIPWFHQIDLENGIITPGLDASASKLDFIKMPDNLNGMTVLDIGAWDGFFSFAAARRGASRAVALDSYVWQSESHGNKRGFELARRVLDSRVEDCEMEVLDIGPERLGTFDLVLFLGVLYHMRHPLLALEKVASVTSQMLILETHVDMLCHDRPVMAFYPGSDLADDPTNWWGPNQAAVEAMLKSVGFREVRAVARAYDSRFVPYPLHRMAFHAWK